MAGEAETAGAAGNALGAGVELALDPGQNRRVSQGFYDPNAENNGTRQTGYDPQASNWGGSPTGLRDYSANLAYDKSQTDQRAAPIANYSQADQSRGLRMEDRSGLTSVADAQRARALGQVPSIAQQVGQRQLGQAVASQGGIAASARGPAGLALAGQVQAGNVAGAQSAITNSTQINAANERLQAEGAAANTYGNLVNSDTAGQAQDASQSQFQAQQQLASRNANDARAQSDEALNFGAQNAQLQAKTAQQGQLANSYNASNQANQQTSQANTDTHKGLVDKLFGAISDERAKVPAELPGLAQGTRILDTATGPVDRFGFAPAQQDDYQGSAGGAKTPMAELKAQSDYATRFVGSPGATSFYSDQNTKYDTKLDPAEEQQFKAWFAKNAPKGERGRDYDYRGAFKAGLSRDVGKGDHFPDTFKKPNHPTFSNESQYAVGDDAAKAGSWNGDKYLTPAKTSERRDVDFIKSGFNPNARPDDAMLDDRAQQNAVTPMWLDRQVDRDRRMTGQEITDAEMASRTPEQRAYTQGSSPQDDKRGVAPGTDDFERTMPRDAPRTPWWVSQDKPTMLSDDRTKLKAAFQDGVLYGDKTRNGAEVTAPDYVRETAMSQPKDSPLHLASQSARAVGALALGAPATVAEAASRPRQATGFHGDTPDEQMAAAARSMQGSPYAYKPGFAEASGQRPGEVNVGPMAQNMERSPVAATAIKTDPNTGLKMIDKDKALKVQMAIAANQQKQIDELKGLAPGGRP